jgi:hypothetical protein|tara:strand:+ start:143 stop:436 length:294 start_codon:yes stop_codon:yes gene_type:complete
MQRLSRCLGLFNKACGAALVLTGGWAAFDARAYGRLRTFNWPEVLGAVLLSIYVAGSGAMLLRYELAGDRCYAPLACCTPFAYYLPLACCTPLACST